MNSQLEHQRKVEAEYKRKHDFFIKVVSDNANLLNENRRLRREHEALRLRNARLRRKQKILPTIRKLLDLLAQPDIDDEVSNTLRSAIDDLVVDVDDKDEEAEEEEDEN